jgi:hypothetical protein
MFKLPNVTRDDDERQEHMDRCHTEYEHVRDVLVTFAITYCGLPQRIFEAVGDEKPLVV